MKHLVNFPLEDGDSVAVEVDEPPPEGGTVRASRGDRIISEAQTTLSSSLDKIRPIAASLMQKLVSLPSKPTEVEIEFGIKLSGETGVIIASASIEGNFTIKLKWAAPAQEKEKPAPAQEKDKP